MRIRYTLTFVSFTFLLFIISISSCTQKQEEIEDDTPDYVDTTTLISKYNGKLSHNAGKNCQQCHQKGGNGKAWFTIAGTVYDSTLSQIYPNATVFIYDGLDNTAKLVAQIEVDSLGNFFTTQPIEYGNGLHVEVEGQELTAKMGSQIRSGTCNKCHGITTNYIWTK